MRIMLASLLAGAVGCSGAVDDRHEAPDAGCWRPAEPSYGTPDSAAAVQASTEAAACLLAHCTAVATCAEVTAGRPICVEYTNGGILLDLYACPEACCD